MNDSHDHIGDHFGDQTLHGRSQIAADLTARGMSPTVLAEEAAPLRPRRKLRHQRQSPLRPFARPLLMALLCGAVPAILFLWAVSSPQFAVRQITIEIVNEDGTPQAVQQEVPERVTASWVHQALRPAIGHNLLRLPLRWAQAQLDVHPWIHSASVRKELPGRLHLRIVEKEAVALYRIPSETTTTADGLAYVDRQGEIIDTYGLEDGPVDLILVSAAPGVSLRGAVDLLAEIRAVSPSWEDGLSEIQVLGSDDELQIDSSDLPFPLLVRRGTLARRAPSLDAILPRIASRYPHISSVDLRYSRRIIVQPSVAPQGAHRAKNG